LKQTKCQVVDILDELPTLTCVGLVLTTHTDVKICGVRFVETGATTAKSVQKWLCQHVLVTGIKQDYVMQSEIYACLPPHFQGQDDLLKIDAALQQLSDPNSPRGNKTVQVWLQIMDTYWVEGTFLKTLMGRSAREAACFSGRKGRKCSPTELVIAAVTPPGYILHDCATVSANFVFFCALPLPLLALGVLSERDFQRHILWREVSVKSTLLLCN
jgi:hypothetical protein